MGNPLPLAPWADTDTDTDTAPPGDPAPGACARALAAGPPDPPEPAELAQEHEALLAFLYAVPVGLAQLDLDGQVLVMNGHTAMLLMPLAMRHGCGLDNLFELLAPLVPTLRQRVDTLDRASGTVFESVRLPLSAPGEPPRWGSLKLVKLDQQRLIACITDITAQVQAEQARQQAEEQLRFAMNAAHVGHWTMDVVTLTMRGSPQFSHCFGPQPLPADFDLHMLLSRIHPGDRDAAAQAFDAAIVAHQALRVEFRVLWHDGSCHWIALHGRPLMRPGQPLFLTGVVLDMTQEREAEAMRQLTRELTAENERLAGSLRLKSRFVATMTHELRSPMTSIIGYAELLRGGVVPCDAPEHAQCLELIARNGQHLLRLINDVLDLSKVEAGKLEFRPEPLALPRLADEMREVMRPQWQSKHQSLAVEVGEGLERLHLDPARLRQVLYNLLSNAIKFTPEGGRITLRARTLDGGRFELSVRDTGIGIPPSDHARLFTEFQQLHNGADRPHEGTGLGLALTRRLLQAQGGDISVHSNDDCGTEFRVWLPRSHMPAQTGPSAGPSAGPGRLPGPLPGPAATAPAGATLRT